MYIRKKISPVHEQIVLLHILGKKNTEIAALVERDKVTVSQVLNDPRIEELKEDLRDRARASLFDNIEDKLTRLAAKSVDNIAITVETPMQPGTKAKQHQDKIGLELLGILGYSKNNISSGRGETSELSMTEENQTRLVSAIERANAVRKKHKVDEAEEVDAEIVDKDEG